MEQQSSDPVKTRVIILDLHQRSVVQRSILRPCHRMCCTRSLPSRALNASGLALHGAATAGQCVGSSYVDPRTRPVVFTTLQHARHTHTHTHTIRENKSTHTHTTRVHAADRHRHKHRHTLEIVRPIVQSCVVDQHRGALHSPKLTSNTHTTLRGHKVIRDSNMLYL